MKFSFKKLAAAVALAAAATGASAAIDPGQAGDGELFFNIWDASGSYSMNLGDISITSFESQIAAGGFLNLSYNLGADSVFTSFLSGVADTSKLKWNVQAVDVMGAKRVLETYSVMPTATKQNDVIRAASANVSALANYVNVAGVNSANSVAVPVSSNAYAGKAIYGSTINTFLNFSNAGTLANDSYADGLNFMRIDAAATGIAKSTYTQYADAGQAVRIFIDGSNVLQIQALPVPEPESYAMLLAGLGMIGFMARRRLGNRA